MHGGIFWSSVSTSLMHIHTHPSMQHCCKCACMHICVNGHGWLYKHDIDLVNICNQGVVRWQQFGSLHVASLVQKWLFNRKYANEEFWKVLTLTPVIHTWSQTSSWSNQFEKCSDRVTRQKWLIFLNSTLFGPKCTYLVTFEKRPN